MPPIFRIRANVKLEKYGINGIRSFRNLLNKTYYLSKSNNTIFIKDANSDGQFKISIDEYQHYPVTINATTVDYKSIKNNEGSRLQFRLGITNNTRNFTLENYYKDNNVIRVKTRIHFTVIQENDNLDQNYYNFFQSI